MRKQLAPIMATTILLMLAIFGFNGSACAASPEEQIRQLETAFNAAYAKNDLPNYFSYYADDFHALFPEGPTTLDTYRKEWTASVNAGNVLVAFTYTDMQIQVSPSEDAAVVTYRATARMRHVGKEPVDEKYFETDVWFKRGGIWKVVEVHYSQALEK